MIKDQPEFRLQRSMCKWLSLAHPKVLFMSDTVASIKLTQPQKIRNKDIQKKDFKTPDLTIFEPNNKYHGLFIEFKVVTPFKKDGSLKKNEHIEGQQKTIDQLKSKGYYACFGWEPNQIIKIINDYLSNKL